LLQLLELLLVLNLTRAYVVSWIACYADAVAATSMSLINRFCLKVFPLPNTLLMLQMIATIAILYPLLLTGKLTFSMWNYHRFKQLLAISVLYTANTGENTNSCRTSAVSADISVMLG